VTAPRIAVVDYGMGNRRSVEKALEHVGALASITRDHDELRSADGLIVPGVGAFPRAVSNLAELGLDELIVERAQSGTPLLGICLGMQLLFERSSELGGAQGLALLAGAVRELDPGERKLPHIGWNLVTWSGTNELSAGLPGASAFYHVHSLVAEPADETHVLARAEYGERFVTAVADESGARRIYGVQFHPEKSSADGLRLLANFTSICAQVPA
jgi:glutamine amidotransferase